MPTTTNRGYATPVTGTEIDTWGDVLNANFGLIDSNLGAVTNVALSNVNVTLNSTQYACGTVRLSGVLTGNVTVTFPAIQAEWNIDNVTTGAFTVTIASAGAGDSITSSQGVVTPIITDGTNIKAAGQQTILTGDVTGTGIGTVATTIANNAVTTAKILDANVTLAKLATDVTNELAVPTQQKLTSGSGATYTTPANVRQLRIRMVGGGGGGGAVATNAGSTGGTSSFNSITAIGGGGGAIATVGTGGVGGVGGAGSASLRIGGGAGSYGNVTTSGTMGGGTGGSSALGGAGLGGTRAGSAGSAAQTNSGSGGGGAGAGAAGNASGGGGAGEYVELIINSPAASYIYTVGTGGAGGTAGTFAGGNGAAGIIIVDEIY